MSEHRSGFVALVGRPNSGKSTLTNALVGDKVAITSGRPQTTRHVIRGIVTRPEAQLVLVDTPGLHRPRTLLGQRLNDQVAAALASVDAVVMCLPAPDAVGPGDRFIAGSLPPRVPRVAAVTKTDLVSRQRLAAHLAEVGELAQWDDVVPVSAVTGSQLDDLWDAVVRLVPPGPVLYPDGEATDEPTEVFLAELIREAALEGVRDELPHSLAVVVEEITPAGSGQDDGAGGKDGGRRVTRVVASIYVERDSQKGIVIGKGGSNLRAVGARARMGIEAVLGEQVFLDLHVKVAKDWQRDPRLLAKLGFDV